MKQNLTFTKVSPKDYSFINELLKSRGGLLGYPNCQSMREIETELNVFENTSENCLRLISREDEVIGIGGLFYTEGETEAMLYGPVLVPVYHEKPYLNQIIEMLVDECVCGISKIEAVVASENSLLCESLSEMSFVKKESQMKLEKLIYKVEETPLTYKIVPITKVAEIVSMFHLLDEAFYWDGHTERMEELLNQGYEMACAKSEAGDVLGVMSWSQPDLETIELEYIVVSPKARRQGVATSLLYYLFNWCYEHEAHNITLLTGLDNPAIKLYQSLGFMEVMTSTIYERYCFDD